MAKHWADGVTQVAVLGAGTMGEGIAQGFAEAGVAVRLVDLAESALARCHAQIGANLKLAFEAGVRDDDGTAALALVTTIRSGNPAGEVAGCPFVIETVPEIGDLKRDIFRQFDALPSDVIVASNTSSMTMNQICVGMATGDRAIGVHYFNPAHLIPAVELHRSDATSAATIARTRALIARTGKTPIVVNKAIPGLVINRLTGALMREIGYLLDEEVISPEDLDAGVKASIGFRMAWVGPMEGSDFTGLDVGARVQAALLPTLSNRTGPFRQLLDKVERGELGLKALKGWYDYQEGDRERLLGERNARLLQQLRLFHADRKSGEDTP